VLRTLYRDIDMLRPRGRISMARPVGYVLRRASMLPPLMFQRGGVERWCWVRAGSTSAPTAHLPTLRPTCWQDRRGAAQGPARNPDDRPVDRAASRSPRVMRTAQGPPGHPHGRKIGIFYRDKDGVASKRTIWPFGVGFFEKNACGDGVCELRGLPPLRTDESSRWR